MLNRAEYVEQTYFFRTLAERICDHVPIQDVLAGLREETLTTTKLPLAIDYMLSELCHQGVVATAMSRLSHYFAPFQTYVVDEAENDRGRFDMRLAFKILQSEAQYRAEDPTPQGIFLFQFETICRNRLSYDCGLAAIAKDPLLNQQWKQWVLTVRRQIGLVDFADMVYVRSQYYRDRCARGSPSFEAAAARKGQEANAAADAIVLFGENEGKIAWANRRKDPLFLFSALQRQLGYPVIPRPQPADDSSRQLPSFLRRIERLETRMKLVEEERGKGIDLTQFFHPPDRPGEN